MQSSILAIVFCVGLVIVRTQIQFEENGTVVEAISSDCGVLGSLSGIYCVTEVAFKLDLLDSIVFSCPTGLFCANHLQICVVDGPACRHNRGCDFCSENATYTCVAQRQYAACNNGVPSVNADYCPESSPYCSMPSDKQGVPFVQCSSVIQSMACETLEPPIPDPPTPDPPSPPPTNETEFICPGFGKFADPFDTTCKTYYYCYNDNGVLTAMQFKCTGNTVFSKEKQKCVFRIPCEC